MPDQIWLAFDIANELADIKFYNLEYYDLEGPSRKIEYEEKMKTSLVFDTADLKHSQTRSAELFKTLVGQKLEEHNREYHDYLDP